jgi:hypothetical protein
MLLWYVIRRNYPRTTLHRFLYIILVLPIIGGAYLLSCYASLQSVEPNVLLHLIDKKILSWPGKEPLPPSSNAATSDTGFIEEAPFPGPYPHFLTFRPANGATPKINPPRMSWPYVAGVIPDEDVVAQRSFILQISALKDFSRLELEIETELNFFNALAPLPAGTWFWRVGYLSTNGGIEWSPSRRFIVTETTPVWDRTPLQQARKQITSMPHPRLGPADGDWEGWAGMLSQDPARAALLERLTDAALDVTQKSWWQSFPETDRWPWSKHNEMDWAQSVLT